MQPEPEPRKLVAADAFNALVGTMVALPMALQVVVDDHPQRATLLVRLDEIRREALVRLGDTGNDWGTKAIEKVVCDLERGLRGRDDRVTDDFGEGAPDMAPGGDPQEKMNASFAWMMGQVRALEVALEVCVATHPGAAALHTRLPGIRKETQAVLRSMDESDFAALGAERTLQKVSKLLSTHGVA